MVDIGETIPKFYGRYHLTLDDKGRAAIPAKIREIMQLRDMQTLVLRLFEKPNARFIRAYPATYFRDKILPMASQFDEENEEGIYHMQNILASCQQLRLDAQGRVNIPAEFLEIAQIQKEIRYVGMGDFFDIWNPAVNDQFVTAGRMVEGGGQRAEGKVQSRS
ncbi:MAG: Transcriptional regulator MraZ [bacterium]|nr:Transcriptional regulator MraZ [bacterium]